MFNVWFEKPFRKSSFHWPVCPVVIIMSIRLVQKKKQFAQKSIDPSVHKTHIDLYLPFMWGFSSRNIPMMKNSKSRILTLVYYNLFEHSIKRLGDQYIVFIAILWDILFR